MFQARKVVVVVATVAVMAAACSSSKSSSSSSSSAATSAAPATTAAAAAASSTTAAPGSNGTYTIGILTDATGPAASGNKTSVQGVQAGAVIAAQDGYIIKTVVGDTATSPSTALAAAQKMVTEDHVDAVISVSALAFGAAPYLTAQGIPVIGVAEDGPEWIASKNMFSVFGFLDTTKVGTTLGNLFKLLGATTIGSLGYSISPSSAESAKASAVSAQAAGLKVGYLNYSFPFGSTNVQPIALAMKNGGIDAFTASVDPNTGFAMISALRNLGVNLKAAVLPTGYGGDLEQAGPGALQSAQGVYFYTSFEPFEMNTPATQQMAAALKTVGVTGDPTYAEYAGYTSVALLLQGLQAAGPHATSASLLTALSGIQSYNAAGLFGTHHISMSDRAASAGGVDGCEYVVKLTGSTFDLVPGADPICGTIIPGKTVTPAT